MASANVQGKQCRSKDCQKVVMTSSGLCYSCQRELQAKQRKAAAERRKIAEENKRLAAKRRYEAEKRREEKQRQIDAEVVGVLDEACSLIKASVDAGKTASTTKQVSHCEEAARKAEELSRMAGCLQGYRQASGQFGELASEVRRACQEAAKMVRTAGRLPKWDRQGMGLARFSRPNSLPHDEELAWRDLTHRLRNIKSGIAGLH